MKLLRRILFPFVPIYYFITWLRNLLYDLGIKKSSKYNFPIICVGNLSVGGTGKTPMIEYLIKLLKAENSVATLSRGYKRQTKGFLLADKNATAASIGDEPFQFYNKFNDDIQVAVDTDRRHGIACLQNLNTLPEIILLDDAYQHRKVKAGLNILLTTYTNPYFTDIVLPTGDLREPRDGAKRADAIIVTKCPETISEADKKRVIKKISPKDNQQVFFSSIKYSNTVFSSSSQISVDDLKDFTLVTGIANPKPLIDFLHAKHLNFMHLNFRDHYEFTTKDITQLSEASLILTTEKDFMRLKPYKALSDKLFYLPIELVIDKDLMFNELVKRFVKSF